MQFHCTTVVVFLFRVCSGTRRKMLFYGSGGSGRVSFHSGILQTAEEQRDGIVSGLYRDFYDGMGDRSALSANVLQQGICIGFSDVSAAVSGGVCLFSLVEDSLCGTENRSAEPGIGFRCRVFSVSDSVYDSRLALFSGREWGWWRDS